MGNRWIDIEQLKRDRDTALRLVKEGGIRLCFDMQERNKAKETFLPILRVFKDELSNSPLSLIFLYKESEQMGEFAYCDGLCCPFYNEEENREFSAIGVSVELINGDPDFRDMVILHELTHLFYGQCEPGFFGLMDILIRRFNKATRRSIENDYYERLSDTLVKTVRGGKGDEH